jgi:hypothetical protein
LNKRDERGGKPDQPTHQSQLREGDVDLPQPAALDLEKFAATPRRAIAVRAPRAGADDRQKGAGDGGERLTFICTPRRVNLSRRCAPIIDMVSARR